MCWAPGLRMHPLNGDVAVGVSFVWKTDSLKKQTPEIWLGYPVKSESYTVISVFLRISDAKLPTLNNMSSSTCLAKTRKSLTVFPFWSLAYKCVQLCSSLGCSYWHCVLSSGVMETAHFNGLFVTPSFEKFSRVALKAQHLEHKDGSCKLKMFFCFFCCQHVLSRFWRGFPRRGIQKVHHSLN